MEKIQEMWNHQADYNRFDERAGTRNSHDAFLLLAACVAINRKPLVPWGLARTISEENPKLVECLKIRHPYFHRLKGPQTFFLSKPYVETHVPCNCLRAKSTNALPVWRTTFRSDCLWFNCECEAAWIILYPAANMWMKITLLQVFALGRVIQLVKEHARVTRKPKSQPG